MPQQLRIDEPIDTRMVDVEVVKNVGIPSDLPSAERVASVNARVELTEVTVGSGYVTVDGIIRATIFYVSKDDPSKVISIRRNFSFTDRINISGARPGYDAEIEALISDIDFYIINDRLLGVEFTVSLDIEITAPESISIIEERPGIDFRRQEVKIQRRIRERNYSRNLESIERLPSDADDIRRIIEVDNTVQTINIITNYDQVRVRGVVNSSILYEDTRGQLEYASVSYGFNESFPFSGVTPDMEAFIEIDVVKEEATRIDSRRVKINTGVKFKILVIKEEIVRIPIGIIGDRVFPISRTIIVERIVAEERTRVLQTKTITVPTANPDVDRVISASGNIRGGSIEVEAQDGGVLISGTVDANIIYVADEPEQPVYFAPATINFSSFINIPEVTSVMDAYADITINRITATKASDREISVRVVLNINLVVTERIRVPIVTGISERPTGEPPVTPTPPDARYLTYTIKSGDTLYLIAQKFGVTVDRLIQINNITNPSNIQIGQKILIPRG